MNGLKKCHVSNDHLHFHRDSDGDHAKVQEISTQLWEQRIGQGGQLMEQIFGITWSKSLVSDG